RCCPGRILQAAVSQSAPLLGCRANPEESITFTESRRTRFPCYSLESLHKMLPGVVLRQWVRCGRPNCRCARGQLHGPYFYRFGHEGGRLRKEYVRRRDVDQVRARCEARQQYRKERKAGWQKWRELLAAVRGVEQT